MLASVLAAYLLIHFAVPLVFSGFARTYVVQPVVWSLLSLTLLLLLAAHGIIGRMRLGWSRFLLLGLALGVFQVACTGTAGLLTSFGTSPYSHDLYHMFLNFVFWGTAMVAIELSRAYILRSFSPRHILPVVALVSLFFTVIMIAPAKYKLLGGSMEPLSFFGGTFLPLLAQNMLACFLALAGGPLAAIAYRGVLAAFEWFSPILPDLPWITKAFVETMAPVMGLLIVQAFADSEPETRTVKVETKARKARFAWAWVMTGIVGVTVLWFSVGALGFRPIAVVSGSMSPAIGVGDLAVVKEVSPESLKEGDVIMYRQGVQTTIHRVVEVRQNGAARQFVTKGDANDTPDLELVRPDQIEGRVSFCVPKLGWVSMKLKDFLGKVF